MAGLFQKTAKQQFRIALPVSQGGDFQIQHIEAVEQIGPQSACLDGFERIFVGRGNDAHIDRDDLVIANPHDFARLQGAQHLGLKENIHFRQFIKEQRAFMGQLEKPDLASTGGAGKGPWRIAEELAFQKVPGQCGAVHGHKGAI